MKDYKLSEISEICDKYYFNGDEKEACAGCPFFLRNWYRCWFDWLMPYSYYLDKGELNE